MLNLANPVRWRIGVALVTAGAVVVLGNAPVRPRDQVNVVGCQWQSPSHLLGLSG